MADNVDQANEKTQALTEGLLALIKENAAIPKGVAGICDECEEEKTRLVGGLCALCRDGQ